MLAGMPELGLDFLMFVLHELFVFAGIFSGIHFLWVLLALKGLGDIVNIMISQYKT